MVAKVSAFCPSPYLNYPATNVLAKVLGALILLVLPLILDEPSYGAFVLAFSGLNLIAVLVPSGHYEALIALKCNNRRRELLKNILDFKLLAFLILGTIVSISTIGMEQKILFLSIIVGGLSLGLALTIVKYLMMTECIRDACSYLFWYSLICNLGSAIAVLVTNRWESYFFTMAILGILNYAICYKLFSKSNSGYSKGSLWLLRYCLPYVIIAMAGWASGYGFNFLVKTHLDLSQVGAFGFIFTLCNFILVITNSVNLVWATRNCSKESLDQEIWKDNSVWKVMIGFITLFTVLLWLVYPYLINWLYYDKISFRNFGDYILLVGIAYVFYVPAWKAKNGYYYYEKSKLLALITLCSSSAGIFFSVYLIHEFKVLGAYLGFAVLMGIQSGPITFFSSIQWGSESPWKTVLLSSALLLTLFIFS